mgnify:CR=1 FL=1
MPQDNPPSRPLRVAVDERNLTTTYANGFRASSTPEELVLDFGLNLPHPSAAEANQPEVVFVLNARVVMNHYSAKRLALTLGQHIRRHEELYGELELDAENRRASPRPRP